MIFESLYEKIWRHHVSKLDGIIDILVILNSNQNYIKETEYDRYKAECRI